MLCAHPGRKRKRNERKKKGRMESIYIWAITIAVALSIFTPYLLKFHRQNREAARRREEALSLGITQPRAQYPFINQSLCIGCGSCVSACPEGDVLGIVYGKAEIINGLRCVGHGHCEDACPVGAIRVGLGDISTREDIPLLDEDYQSGVPGLYVVGELGGLSLIRNAISQGTAAVEAIARQPRPSDDDEIKDVVIVGAGPAGLSAALCARKHQLSYALLDQQPPGGTILQYPRRKLVMTQPVEIPLYGKLTETEYSKEKLLEIWQSIIEKFEVKIEVGHKVESVERREDGTFVVRSSAGETRGRHVVLAMGRRGTPRKLGVPGEETAKVAYQLIDAQSYTDANILVVGGGDSAVEAAVGLARQTGNKVSVSYRKNKFYRIKKKNEERSERLIRSGKIRPIWNSNVLEILPKSVRLQTPDEIVEIPNDFVFIFAGGIPPFKLLQEMGIRFGGEKKPIG